MVYVVGKTGGVRMRSLFKKHTLNQYFETPHHAICPPIMSALMQTLQTDTHKYFAIIKEN